MDYPFLSTLKEGDKVFKGEMADPFLSEIEVFGLDSYDDITRIELSSGEMLAIKCHTKESSIYDEGAYYFTTREEAINQMVAYAQDALKFFTRLSDSVDAQ